MSSVPSTLVLGGARSGKSAFAESLFQSIANRAYLATATAHDDEMHERIRRHQADRGSDWTTIEEPVEILSRLSADDEVPVLVDCLTLWLTNLFMAERDISAESSRLAGFLSTTKRSIVLVSNEIGLGLVPETKLGRDFRDAQGRLNQMIAASVPRVVFVAAGLPLYLKGAP